MCARPEYEKKVSLIHNFIRMKKIHAVCILCFLLVLSIPAVAQEFAKVHEGKIIYDISYPDAELDQQTMAMLPDESVMYFKDEKGRVEIKMAFGSTVILMDNEKKENVMLMDMMGKKTATVITETDLKKEKEKQAKPEVKLLDDTKQVAGFLCHKAVVTMKGKESDITFDVWYTRELPARNSLSSRFEGVDGLMLEYVIYQRGMNMKFSARSFEPIKVDDDLFVIPEGYEKKTMQEIIKPAEGK